MVKLAFQIRVMEPEDYQFAVALANTMNWNMTEEDFAFNLLLEPGGCFVALDRGKPVGMATCISYGKTGWFGNLIVQEQNRGQGVGVKLVRKALNYLKGMGALSVGLYAYQNLADFYGNLGFVGDVDFVVMKADAVSAPGITDSKLKAIKTVDFPGATKIDAECFGASRSKLLELIFKNTKNVGFACFDNSAVIGFSSAKVFEESAEIGPIVHTGEPKTAKSLLGAILNELSGFEAYLYVVSSAKPLLDIAVEAGFREQFRLTRMFWGLNVAKSCIYSAESLERG